MYIYRRIAQYHETDQMGIIHHSNYVKWMEEARVAFLDHVGLGYGKVEKMGIVSPVAGISLEYKKQVQFGDEVEIRVEVQKYNGVVLEFHYEFYNLTKDEVCTNATSRHGFLKENRIVSLKRELPELDRLMVEYMSDICDVIKEKLFELRDEEYKAFHAKLIPTVAVENIIGVRTPVLRKYAKEMSRHPQIGEFLAAVPHQYYDENNLHGFIIEQYKDYDKCLTAVESFLPYIDNWATCDMLAPKVFGRHTEELLESVYRWIASEDTYTIRFAMNMLMRFYLDEEFRPEYLELVSGVISDEYYVNMMIAWYFATALAKQYDAALPYLEQRKLAPWTHNKTIQKACESYRITAEQKQYLRSLKEKI